MNPCGKIRPDGVNLIQIDPFFHPAYDSKSRCLKLVGKHEENVKFIDEALKFITNQTHKNQMYTYKGQSLLKLKRWDEALRVYDLAIESDRQYGDAYIGRIEALKGLNRIDEADKTSADILRGNFYFVNHATKIEFGLVETLKRKKKFVFCRFVFRQYFFSFQRSKLYVSR